jgi:SAM-dependent methyltransferase
VGLLLSTAHGSAEPSDWVQRWSHLVAPGGTVLDVACGSGRHLRWFAERGHTVTGVDRDPVALSQAAVHGETIAADIENGPWPLTGQTFDAVVVTNYLWRALWPQILASVKPGGVLLYETFAHGQASVGRPSRPEFLLQPGELLRVCADWHTIAYEHGVLSGPTRFVQRIVAMPSPALDAQSLECTFPVSKSR